MIEFLEREEAGRSVCLHTHIAVLFSGTLNNPNIVSSGKNDIVMSCRSPVSDNITIHAEMNAISEYLNNNFSQESVESFRRQKFNLFITKRSKSGLLGTSNPCLNCVRRMYYFGINKVYWTEADRMIKSSRPIDLLDVSITTSGNIKKKLKNFSN